MPFFWVGGLVFALLGNLHAGRLHALRGGLRSRSARSRFLERERATLAIGWPHFGKALAEHPSRRERDLSALRGGNVPDILPDAVCPLDPELRANALGMTETCGPAHLGRPGRGSPRRCAAPSARRCPGSSTRSSIPTSGAPLPAGRARRDLRARLQRDAGPAQGRARATSFDADGFYHTGDAGCFDARGVLYFTGRLGELIKTGGANVTPAEVEAVLAAQPEVKEAYVVGVPDAERGEVVAAAVVLAQGARLDADALRARLKPRARRLQGAAPRATSRRRAALPFTDSGKIDKRRLRALLAASSS